MATTTRGSSTRILRARTGPPSYNENELARYLAEQQAVAAAPPDTTKGAVPGRTASKKTTARKTATTRKTATKKTARKTATKTRPSSKIPVAKAPIAKTRPAKARPAKTRAAKAPAAETEAANILEPTSTGAAKATLERPRKQTPIRLLHSRAVPKKLQPKDE